VTDPLYKNTTLLLQADDAANGAQNNTFLDSSSNAFAITRNGGNPGMTQGSFTPFSSQPGAWSNFFGGSTDYIAFTSIAAYGVGTGNFSVQTFVNFNSISGNQRIFCLGASGTDGINVQFAGSTTQLQLDIANTRIITHTWTPVVGTWYQIDVVRAGTGTNQTTLYINGLSVATGTSSGSVGQNAANIGGLSWNSSFTVNGYVSNVRFSNTARSISAVTTNYSSDANTLLLTAQSNRFVDNSSTGNTFTIGGTPSVQAFSPFAPQFQWTPSVIGGSGYFDGTGDNLTVPTSSANSVGSGSFYFEAWVYLTNPSVAQMIIADPSNTGGLFVGLNIDGGGRFAIGRTAVAVDNFVTVTWVSNQWYHLAVNRNSTSLQFFVNGTQVGSTGTNSVNYPSVGYRVGAEQAAGSSPFFGYMSGLRLIRSSVNTGNFTPPTAPPTAITNTALLLNFTNAGIYDGTMKNVLETVGNAQVSTAVVKYGSGSMYFDGTGDYLIPNAATTDLYAFGSGDFTVEMWIYQLASGTFVLYDTRPSSTNGAYFNISSTSGQLELYANSSSLLLAGTIPLNTWTHIAASRIGTSLRGFINGTQVGSTITNSTVFLGSSQRPVIGASGFNVTTFNFNGYIDDLRVTKGVARYTQNFIPPSVALPRQ